MNDEVFQRYSAYYDLLYRNKDYVAEADYVTRILRAADPNANKLLELGSGTGRHGCLLAQRGFDIFGLERSESMVTAARTASVPLSESGSGSFNCAQGDIRTAKLGRVFDAALALFHVISYQTRNVDVMQTFANAARHLRPRGLFLFDVWHGPAVLAVRPSVRVKRVEDDHTRLIRIAEPELDLNASVVAVRYTMLAESKTDGRLTTFAEQHLMRYFFPVEINFIADHAGFDVERIEEFLTGRRPSDGTWGVAYLLRKRG